MLKPKILVVDDRKENLLALSSVLTEHDYDVVEALSGAEALAAVEQHDFVVILLDVQMPEMNGFEAAKAIRSGARSAATPIIFVTAIHRSEEYESKGYLAGAVDYLFKPVNIDILLAKIAVFTDLYKKTQEIKYQAELLKEADVKEKERQLLKEVIQIRDDFLTMASHELKTPITPLNLQMQAFLQMIEDGTFETIAPERLKRMLLISYSQVERLSRTIEDLLDVSRFRTGQLELKREPVDLGQMVNRIVAAFSAQLNNIGCKCELRVQPNVKGEWDPFRIEQIFINLLSNSMKYASGKPIEITVASDDSHAHLIVKDYGIGIAKEDQSRIFNRFERAASPRSYGGLGLGLYIAGEIAKLHNGTIFVESELNQGSLFDVRLPLRN